MEISHNIHNLSAKQLDIVLERYPWFSYARELSILKMAAIDTDEAENALKNCQAYITRRKKMYEAFTGGNTSNFSLDEIQMEFKSSDSIVSQEGGQAPERVQSGLSLPFLNTSSEYFSPSEIASIGESGNQSILEGALNEGEQPSGSTTEYQTETLALIYEDQEYFNEALDVYAKLILLYPQKSAYFAGCVERIQQKMVQKEAVKDQK